MRDLTNRQREILYNWGSASLNDTKVRLSQIRSMTINDAYRDEIDTVLEHIEYREVEPGGNYEQFLLPFSDRYGNVACSGEDQKSSSQAAQGCQKGDAEMMTQYQMFFMFNYASSDYYRTIEIFSGMMPALRTKLE